jgi:predicted metal-dependent hydrolase
MFLSWKKIKRTLGRPVKKRINRSYQTHKEAARQVIHSRLEYFNQFYEVTYNRVSIRDQRRCWGSCSSKGNLNFSYKLLFLPPCLRDYVVVHELCHLRVLNHSQAFWDTMAVAMPDYAERAVALRQIEHTHGTAVGTLQRVAESHVCTACSSVVFPSKMKEMSVSGVVIS